MNIVCRDYQVRIRDQAREMLRSVRGVIIQMVTGAGKSVTAADMAALAVAGGRRVLFIAHRVELLNQLSEKLTAFGVQNAMIKSGRPGNIVLPVQVASIQTLARRYKEIPFVPDAIFVDECHGSASKTYREVLDYYATVRTPPPAVIGLSATPSRHDGKGLGRAYGGHFDVIIPGPSMQELIDLGFLVPTRVFSGVVMPQLDGIATVAGDFHKGQLLTAVDKPTITGDVISHWKELCVGRKTLVFCISIEHAERVAQQFREAGIHALALNGTWDDDLRARAIKDFEHGPIQVLVNCQLFTEGTDFPIVSCVADLSPTQSLTRWLQKVGRGMRAYPEKKDAILLDHSGSYKRFGLPADPREWSLDGSESKKKSAERALSVRVCPKCLCAQRSGKPTCSNCGFTFQVEGRKVKHKDGKLREITPEMARQNAIRSAERQQMGMTKSYAGLVEYARRKGFRDPEGWSRHVIENREAKKAKRNAEWMKA